jgi:hypothetical protein
VSMDAKGLLEYLQTLPPETEIEIMGHGTVTGGMVLADTDPDTGQPVEPMILVLVAHTGNKTGRPVLLQGGKGRIMQVPAPTGFRDLAVPNNCLCGTDHYLDVQNDPQTSPEPEEPSVPSPEPLVDA